MIPKTQYEENRTANLTANYGKKTIKRQQKKKNVIKYAIWNVRRTVHKEGELDSALNEKQMKILTQRKSKYKMKGTMETVNCIEIYECSGVNRSTQAQADVMIWINNLSNTPLLRAQTRRKE
jgi:hypothetical protein